jgi:hypothetical protein
MDPTISKGVHQEITDNDLSALDTIGWNLTGSAAGTGTGTLIPSAPPTPAAPANDNFASAQVITGCSGSLTSTNVGATRETGAGEPVNPDSSGSTKSVWYQWQAPSSGSVTISTAGSRFDTTLAVYSGSSVGALGTAVAHNDDAADDPNTVEREVSSSVTFNAVQGTTYRIAVNGYNNFGSGDIGRFILNWTAAGCATKTNQTISFSTTAFKAYGDAPFALSATASSNLPVSFSVVSGPVTLNGSTVTITGTGTAVIRASQTGDASYNAAPDVDQVLTISKGTPIITWNDPANIASGTALSSTQLNATANVAGSFAYSPVAGTVLDPGTHGLNVVFTPTDPNYNTATKSVLVNVIAPAGVTLSLNSQVGSVTESAGSLAIPVTRSGDASGAATVEYATTDNSGLTPCNQITGVASSRCDYATTIGTLRFAAGETSKNIFVPIVDDVWAEGTENFTLVLSKPTGATMGSNQVMVVSISDNDANSNGANPVDQNPFFVRQQYIDFLGREPDAAGLQGWQDVLNNCGVTIAQPCDKIEVSAGFFRSKEFQERGYFIYKFYSAIGRIPLYPEFMPDLAKVSGFLSDQQLEANKDAFVTEFMGRSEYQNKYGAITDPTAYVDALLSTVGLPTHPSRGGWIAGLQNNTLTRARVLRELTESSEMQLKYKTESFVIMQYFGYLRRSADASYLAWIDIMNQNPNNYRGMIDGFLNSDEYRKRFGP